MTIAKRLILLLVVPLVTLSGLCLFLQFELKTIEDWARFVAKLQIPSLTGIANVTRTFANMRIHARGYIMAPTTEEAARAMADFNRNEVEFNRFLGEYADRWISDERDRRLFEDYRNFTREWIVGAKKAMAVWAEGQRDDAMNRIFGFLQELADRISQISGEWVHHNEVLAESAADQAFAGIIATRWKWWLANAGVVLVMAWMAVVTFRRIAVPIRSLETSVRAIAAGDYQKEIPFTAASDETGGLARSIEVLKQGAAAMDDHRWVSANTVQLSRGLQGVASPAEFGQRLLSPLLTMLGGGVAGFYMRGERDGRLHSVAAFGLNQGDATGDSFAEGEGLVGQCARDGKELTLTGVPPDYLRIASGTGTAAPAQVTAFPLVSRDSLLAVLEIASFRAFSARERALLDGALPMLAMHLEILQRNLRTQELLDQTQQQARLLEAQTGELRGSEEALKRINFMSDGALDLTKAGYWLIDFSDPDHYTSSERAAAIFGEKPTPNFRYHLMDEWYSRIAAADPAVAEATGRHYADAVAGKAPRYDVTYCYKRPIDGRVAWIRAIGNVERGEDGKPRFMYGVAQDITDIKLAELAMKESERKVRETEQFFRSVLELAPDGLMVVDAGGGIRLANAQCERLFGYTREELVGRPVEMLVPDSIRGGHAALRAGFHRNPGVRAMGTGRVLHGKRKDGSLFAIEIGLSPLPPRENEEAQVAVSIRDITERKQQEAEIVAARQKAEEATQMKSMFLANMSHEIRTPMNAIIGLSHLALRTPLNTKQRDYISKVHNAGTSLLAIINDILDFSKIEAGKIDLESTDFKLDDVITSVTVVTGQKANEKGLEFLAHAAPGIPPVLLGDPLRLGQIITNLVNNAIKFTERGEVHLHAELLESTGEKCQLKFSIRDTGVGMTPEQSARLFQPFTQADMSTTRKHGGTGLGLTICRRLVELMGGQISLESEPGVGTVFTFTVWLGIGRQKGSGKVLPEKLTKLRTLIVDDNAAAREILDELLVGIVAQADAVSSGAEAIAAVKQHDALAPYDVVFMDWRMEGLDGLQAARAIKNDESLKHQPAIVLVTAFGREEVRDEAERLELEGFLVKPVTRSMVVDALVNVFADPADQAAAVKDANRDGLRLEGMRVLLAEDNEINQQIACELLEGVGAKVTVAVNGREAVDRLLQDTNPAAFDVVLMDLQMPVMGGHEATAKIRSEPRFATLPIIAMTAHATLEERQRCLAAGMNDHLAKPIDPGLLFETLARFHRPAGGMPAVTRGAARPAAAQIPAIAGLDTTDGLARVAGNRQLYFKLLRAFGDEQATAAGRIATALDQGDAGTAERLAHSLKGVAGNLGAKAVQAAAGEIERLLRESAPGAELRAAVTKLAAALDPLLAELASALPPTPGADTPAPAAATDPAEIRAAIAKLAKMLEEFDAGAAEFIEQNTAILQPAFAAADWARFTRHARSYAFADALALLPPG